MADAVTSVGVIRSGDTITYIDHFGGDSEGPVKFCNRQRATGRLVTITKVVSNDY